MRSLIYQNILFYRFVMRTLYGQYFEERYAKTAALIENKASVLDVCCGDAYIYFQYLGKKNVDYTGLDTCPPFIKKLKKDGLRVELCDILTTDLTSDYDIVLLMGSLYQFIPQHHLLIEKLFRLAKKRLIVVEAVKNIAGSSNRLIAKLAGIAVNPGTGSKTERFDVDRLRDVFRSYPRVSYETICHGRDVIVVVPKD